MNCPHCFCYLDKNSFSIDKEWHMICCNCHFDIDNYFKQLYFDRKPPFEVFAKICNEHNND